MWPLSSGGVLAPPPCRGLGAEASTPLAEDVAPERRRSVAGCAAAEGARAASSAWRGAGAGRAALLLLLIVAVGRPPGALGEEDPYFDPIIPLSPNGSDIFICPNESSNGTNDTNDTSPNADPYANCTFLPCRNSSCGTHMRREAMLACKGFSGFEIDDGICKSWADVIETDCNFWCGNCTALGLSLYGQCIFYLPLQINFLAAFEYCMQARETFTRARCPAARINKIDYCGSEKDYDECNALCGNFHRADGVRSLGCDCYNDRSKFGDPDVCTGETILKGEIPYSMGLEYSCSLFPRDCMTHRIGTKCSMYTYCPVDVCVVMNVTCPFLNDCQSAGVCNKLNGQCYYTARPDGENCTDFLDYTHGDVCMDGACVGKEDRCMRYKVDCSSRNPCVSPRRLMTYMGVSTNCDTNSGSCMFERVADGTLCASEFSPFSDQVDGRCVGGVCRRWYPKQCDERAACPDLGDCYNTSLCDDYTGECLPQPRPEGTPCSDGKANTYRDICIEGRCVGDVHAAPRFQSMGQGDCIVHDSESGETSGSPIKRYFKDLTEVEDCRAQCMYDPECEAYSYGHNVCSIYGTKRVMDPRGGWKLQTTAAYLKHEVVCWVKTPDEVWSFAAVVRTYLYPITLSVILGFPFLFAVVWTRGTIRGSARRMRGEHHTDSVLEPGELAPQSPKGSAAIAQGTIYEHPAEALEDDAYRDNRGYGSSDKGYADYAHEAPSTSLAVDEPAGLPSPHRSDSPVVGQEPSDPRGAVSDAAAPAEAGTQLE